MNLQPPLIIRSKSCSSSSSFKRRSIYPNKVKLKLQFKSLAVLILELRRLNAEYSLKNKRNDEILPVIQDVTFNFETPKDLLFDPKEYKADRQFRVPEEIKKILNKEPWDRTDDDLRLTEYYLKRIDIISEYPIRMQKRIAKYGVYEKFDCKRIIVRQGHRAASFYIILSGTVVVIVMNDERTKGNVVTYLSKGQAFGELAIIHKTVRQSTIVAKETVEFLSISIKDYHEIFMADGIKMLMDPDYEDFIGNSFLSKFPNNILTNNNERFFFQYFRNNEILARNTNKSNWIYLIKSGEISVIYLELKKNTVKSENSKRNGTRPHTTLNITDTIKHQNLLEESSKSSHVRTAAEDYDVAFSNIENDIKLTQNWNWIQIQLLVKGETVGLSHCLYDDQPDLLLLSHGVEVFMLDRKFFVANCPNKTFVELKQTIAPYPSHIKLTKLIKEHNQWRQFKRQTVIKCISNQTKSKSRI